MSCEVLCCETRVTRKRGSSENNNINTNDRQITEICWVRQQMIKASLIQQNYRNPGCYQTVMYWHNNGFFLHFFSSPDSVPITVSSHRTHITCSHDVLQHTPYTNRKAFILSFFFIHLYIVHLPSCGCFLQG